MKKTVIMKKTNKVASLAATLITIGSLAGGANASLLFTITEDGSDLLITSSGSIDTAGLTLINSTSLQDNFTPGAANPSILYRDTTSGNGTATATFDSSAFSTVADRVPNFGSAAGSQGPDVLTSGTGAFVGLGYFASSLYLPVGYVSGDSLAGTARLVGGSFASLGLTDGQSFVGTLNNDAAETVTVTIGAAAAPEPSSALLLGLGTLGLVARRKRTT